MPPLTIRSLRPDDSAQLIEIYRHESVLAYTAQVPHRSESFWRDFYVTRDPDAVELVAEVQGRAIGHLGLIQNRNPRRKHVASFGLAVHPDFQGQGAGGGLIAEMLNMTDNWLNILRVELSVSVDNARAIALYQRYGFQSEHETRFDLFTGGRFVNTLHMARFHPNWADLVPGQPI
ncbi:GNAT family N-acetyltransferase [Ketogulonicigenium vulgare]|uniref:Acetyltransferase (GNAT) family protein n=1 Tax=Ketogulonicigenium vulgare (strain WSH-001) TaxID=759362 RepID=F9Y5T4_KETVW|nr:GNAT family N-acetyltransferase [Ketogulonicigenium vulgare]ADO43744.1 putative GCN5-related N-acetyltransferase [Ketogulonicigenium vulgare Y25]AEM42009.1 Acetyltransferase (GNAT) family protein [Ketogulonicigenium vulgare WSH-001]ALJ82105.1 GNAT family acetyltransferase [Ketogulonicigenium vulgare]ANW34730.1 GNAT family acetyltransferase [Ketogulonicigenium vulgare]AOZ55777.1 GCN5-related N-acetyltransferase [Ketogulonicigenium vulgare]